MHNAIKHTDDLKHYIREVADFPKPGILFYDITTLLKQTDALHFVVDKLADHYRQQRIDYVLGIEARGFIFGALLAYALGVGFIPVRKPQKLPAEKLSMTYELEYGQASMEIHKDAIQPGERILIIDDLLATGGTCTAVAKMVTALGGEIAGFGFVIELAFLNGRERLSGHEVYSLLQY